MITAIDPGVAQCAYADFRDDVLTRVGFDPPGQRPDVVVVERPEYHGARSNAARTQDLIALTWEGAAAAYRFGVLVVEYGASAWNQKRPKPITHHRLWAVLDDAERALLGGDATHDAIKRAIDKGAAKRWVSGSRWYPASFQTHNLLDAAAIGCVYIGRLE